MVAANEPRVVIDGDAIFSEQPAHLAIVGVPSEDTRIGATLAAAARAAVVGGEERIVHTACAW